jgi:hypothetical protein
MAKSAISNFNSFNNKTKKSAIAGGSGVNQKMQAKKFMATKQSGKSITTRKANRMKNLIKKGSIHVRTKPTNTSVSRIRTAGF